MMSLITQVNLFLNQLPATKNIWVAYSGGVDSHVLLHLLSQQCLSAKLHAIHIHHGLQTQADDWVQHCSQVCQQLQIDFHVCYVHINLNRADSVEALARDARYQAIENIISDNDVVLTAQHTDDQAETLLLQLFRGAGVAGLAAMPHLSQFAQGWLGRPLLNCSRQQIVDYAIENHLHWIEDASNQDTRFERNFLRHNIMPALSQRWSQLNHTLGRAAQHQAEAHELLQVLAAQDLQNALTMLGSQTGLHIETLQHLSAARQRNVIRYWLKSQHFIMPSTSHLQQILTECIQAKADAQPLVKWANVEVRRYQQILFAMSALPEKPQNQIINWHPSHHLALPMGQLKAVCTEGAGLAIGEKLQVRFRQGGEKIYLRGHWRSVKKLLQQSHIAPWLRPFMPLIYMDGQLVAIPDMGMDERFQTKQGWLFHWEH